MNLPIWKRILSTKYGLPLGLCILLQGILFAIVIPLLPIVISEKIGLDKSGVTAFFLMNTLLGIVVALSTGYLSDGAIARHKLVIAGGVIAGLGYLGIATAAQPMHVFIAGAATVAFHVLFPQLFAVARAGIVADWERQAQVMGITALRTLFSLGFVLGTGLASLLVRIMDTQAVFFLIAGAVIALSAYAAVVLFQIETFIAEKSTHTQETATTQSPETRDVVLPLYALIVPLLALIVMQAAQSTRGVYLPLVMFQLFEDASIAPLMFGITAAVELVMMGWIGFLASRIGEKNAISISALFGALYFFVLSVSQSLPVLYLASMWYAVFVAALLGVAMAYVQRLLSHRAGMGGSLYIAVLNMGSLVGILTPLLVAGYDQSIFVLPGVLCIAGAGLLVLGDRTPQIEQRLRAVITPEAALQKATVPSVPAVVTEEEG